jgi:hypothetical protein
MFLKTKKKSCVFATTLFLTLILSLFFRSNADAQRRHSRNELNYGVSSSFFYTGSGFGLNCDLNFYAEANQQIFGAGLLLDGYKNYLSGLNAYYKYTIANNPRIFTKNEINGLDLFVQGKILLRVTPVNYVTNNIDITQSDYRSTIEFLVGPGARYWIDKNFMIDLSTGLDFYINSPKKEKTHSDDQKSPGGVSFFVQLGVCYQL